MRQAGRARRAGPEFEEAAILCDFGGPLTPPATGFAGYGDGAARRESQVSHARFLLPLTLGILLPAAPAMTQTPAAACRSADVGRDCIGARRGADDAPFAADQAAVVPAAGVRPRASRAPVAPQAARPGGKRVKPVVRKRGDAAPDKPKPTFPTTLDEGLAWSWCGLPESALPLPAGGGVPAEALTEVEADSAELTIGDHVAVLKGDVRLTRGVDTLRADQARYDRQADRVDVQGNVFLTRPDLRITGDAGWFELAPKRGEITGAEYRLVGFNARGKADKVWIDGEALSKHSGVTYTTCRPDSTAWLLSAGSIEFDRAEGFGDARDAVLRIGDVPVAYVPRFVFPIDERRRTGFLYPSVGGSGSSGFKVEVPYYLNLAPNYDATLVPRFYGTRGFLLGGEFRHLSESSWSQVRGDVMPRDDEEPDLGVRGFVAAEHHQSWGRLSADLIYQHVSDDFFLSDFGSALAETSTRYLDRRASVAYGGDGWYATAAAIDYQAVEAGLNPYRLLPTVTVGGSLPQQVAGRTLNLSGFVNYSNFDRDVGVVGQRIDLYPSASLPLRSAWGYVVPKAGLRYTTYDLDGQVPGEPESPDRTVGLGSVDSGLIFERDSSWFGQAVTQTLEPRLYYLYVPRVDQNELPIFDTAQFEQLYETLFLENQFTGPDRINDMNRLSAGVSTRFLAGDTGVELLRLSLGQAYYFADREVQLPGVPTQTSRTSPVIGEIGLQLDRHWSVLASGQWDPDEESDSNQPDKKAFRVAYRGDDGRFVRGRYGETETISEFYDVAFSWPVAEKVNAIGRFAYSLQDEEVMDAIAGVEYGSCCWRLRAYVRQGLRPRSSDAGTVGEQDTSFLVQLELRGLGAFGSDADELIDRSLHGFLKSDTLTR
jgi:LPS-assembly protein